MVSPCSPFARFSARSGAWGSGCATFLIDPPSFVDNCACPPMSTTRVRPLPKAQIASQRCAGAVAKLSTILVDILVDRRAIGTVRRGISWIAKRLSSRRQPAALPCSCVAGCFGAAFPAVTICGLLRSCSELVGPCYSLPCETDEKSACCAHCDCALHRTDVRAGAISAKTPANRGAVCHRRIDGHLCATAGRAAFARVGAAGGDREPPGCGRQYRRGGRRSVRRPMATRC